MICLVLALVATWAVGLINAGNRVPGVYYTRQEGDQLCPADPGTLAMPPELCSFTRGSIDGVTCRAMYSHGIQLRRLQMSVASVSRRAWY